jgi:hypothetical protein
MQTSSILTIHTEHHHPKAQHTVEVWCNQYSLQQEACLQF